jgi:hypothetical protein
MKAFAYNLTSGIYEMKTFIHLIYTLDISGKTTYIRSSLLTKTNIL